MKKVINGEKVKKSEKSGEKTLKNMSKKDVKKTQKETEKYLFFSLKMRGFLA